VSSAAPFEVGPTGSGSGDWRTLLASLALHLAIILLVLTWNQAREEQAEMPPPREESRIALEPPVRYEEQVPDQPPPPPERPTPLGPDSDNPDAPVPQEQGDPTPIPEDAERALDPGGTPDAGAAETPQEAPKVPTPADLPSTGITGPPTSPFGNFASPMPSLPPARTTASAAGAMGRAGFGAQDTRGFRQSFENAAGQCVRIPDPGVNPDGSPVLFSVVGVVRDERGRPLPRAHLQLVGQVYATFTDGSGNYRLEFNPKLLDECRVQVVRVTADGYRGADLTLAIGRRVQSDDVFLKRK